MINSVTQSIVCITTLTFLVVHILPVVSRQMCYTCQYVLNGPGIECVTSPLNWTGGQPRMRCPNRCTTLAEYDSNTGKPTFFFRGCASLANGQKDGCHDNGARHSCFYSCGDGHDYCNDKSLPVSPIFNQGEDGRHGRSNHVMPFVLHFICPVFISITILCKTILRL